jgi:hypothetical protein
MHRRQCRSYTAKGKSDYKQRRSLLRNERHKTHIILPMSDDFAHLIIVSMQFLHLYEDV